MLRLYSGAFQALHVYATGRHRAAAEGDNAVRPLEVEGYHCLKVNTDIFYYAAAKKVTGFNNFTII